MEQIETSTSGGEMGWGGVEPNKCILLDQKLIQKFKNSSNLHFQLDLQPNSFP